MLSQKLPRVVAESAGLPNNGNVGVRGEHGSVTTVPYTMASVDGRVILGAQAWREFHEPRELPVGQAILITPRNTSRRNLEMMMVIHYL